LFAAGLEEGAVPQFRSEDPVPSAFIACSRSTRREQLGGRERTQRLRRHAGNMRREPVPATRPGDGLRA
jgi:hypothetical protein